jgi:hypothetical protein
LTFLTGLRPITGKNITAALADRAAAPLPLRPCGVSSLCAALAYISDFVEPLPHVPHLDLMNSLLAQVRDDVEAA